MLYKRRSEIHTELCDCTRPAQCVEPGDCKQHLREIVVVPRRIAGHVSRGLRRVPLGMRSVSRVGTGEAVGEVVRRIVHVPVEAHRA